MPFLLDTNYNHFCNICNKGFTSGTALGGHMRAHGVVGDDIGHMNDDDDNDPPSDWEDKLDTNDNNNNNNNNNAPPTTKRMYALRENPNRLKNYSNCEHCGKEFSSWKSYFEHGRCTASYDAESPVSSPGYDDEVEYNDVEDRKPGWSKRKRSLRAKIDDHSFYRPSSEEEDLANCLMMLSNATIDRSMIATELEESCASASKDEEFHTQNLINFVTSAPANIAYRVLASDNKAKGLANRSHINNNNNNNNKSGLFECKACKKVFNSHQALGGHRASHKKVKGCFASRLDHLDDNLVRGDDDVTRHEDHFFHSKTLSSLTFDHGANATSSSSKRKSKVHECSICHRIFSSGQALGGHKRCHWITSNSTDPSSLAKQIQQLHHHSDEIQHNGADQPLNLNLDLNLPAPARDRFRVPAEIYGQSWLRVNEDKNATDNNGHVDDEADSKVKLAKLSELKDMNVNGNTSPWLQVGIGSASQRQGLDP